MNISQKISLVGVASGIAAADPGTRSGPILLRSSLLMREFKENWHTMLQPMHEELPLFLKVAEICNRLGQITANLVRERKFFTVLGGDHSCAIGTWSGVAHQLSSLGLIWIDAHMDSHTPETSESGYIHGMPLASLLGYGDKRLTELLGDAPKLKPENICLIGTRSYEKGEAKLLNDLNVRIYLMDEVNQRGLTTVMKEAVERVSKNTTGFGVSLDLDVIDPSYAPGTGVKEPNGIYPRELLTALAVLQDYPQFVGAEIVEFDPSKDKEQLTEKLIPQFIQTILKCKTTPLKMP